MYSLIKPLLFRLDPERAHDIVMSTLAALSGSAMAMRAMGVRRPPPAAPVTFMNLTASNGVGLAAGLDKDARAFPALAALGFGWIEVGTVTPLPQPGNDRPRLFRLAGDRALINRMGFNSCGIERFLANIVSRRRHYDGVLGINIGKNAQTTLDRAADDYVHAFVKAYPFADYVTVNVSSPNTESLRNLQHIDRLRSLVEALKNQRRRLESQTGRLVPIVLKLSPDIPEKEIEPTCALLKDEGVDGIIATNTTVSRPPGLTSPFRDQPGGLSGPPLEPLATRMVRSFRERLGNAVPIIAAGGVEDRDSAARKLSAGAAAVQCYTAFVYQGPGLPGRLLGPPLSRG